ncbi:amino acid ABC transporter permease [Bordetella pertussis]|nr:amino acid ABC transporter permease [Bordetella pertussis]
MPALKGFNFQGGLNMSPEFAASTRGNGKPPARWGCAAPRCCAWWCCRRRCASSSRR